ncbi:MAG: FAD-dependent oxidoreductase, partial [Patescibacteria group bacterium]
GIGAVNLVLALKKPFLSDGTYWLNINESNMPFLAVVEHTNFMPQASYGDDHLVYVGNYLSTDHPFFGFTSKQLINKFLPSLKKINPEFKSDWIRDSWVFKAPFAQPIVTTHYSQLIPPMTTPVNNLFLANIQQVYPYDRGTNYAVELGEKAAKLCTSESKLF